MIRALSRIRTLATMESQRRALVIEAMAMLALARAWLAIAPFRHIARRLGNPAAEGDLPLAELGREERLQARAVRWAIELAATRVPFRAVCLQQAVAAKLMLRRRGVPATVRFGMASGIEAGDPPRAHAWVQAGKVKVCGFPVDEDMVPLARFD